MTRQEHMGLFIKELSTVRDFFKKTGDAQVLIDLGKQALDEPQLEVFNTSVRELINNIDENTLLKIDNLIEEVSVRLQEEKKSASQKLHKLLLQLAEHSEDLVDLIDLSEFLN